MGWPGPGVPQGANGLGNPLWPSLLTLYPRHLSKRGVRFLAALRLSSPRCSVLHKAFCTYVPKKNTVRVPPAQQEHRHCSGVLHIYIYNLPWPFWLKLLARQRSCSYSVKRNNSQTVALVDDYCSSLQHTLQTLQPQPLKSGGSKPLGADGHAMDEPMGVDSDTTEELPGLKTPQKAPCSLLWKQPAAKMQMKQI